MATGAGVLAIAAAVATLTSSLGSSVELVKGLRQSWRDRRVSRARLTELEELEQSLELARDEVQNAYWYPRQQFGRTFEDGDDYARFALFALAAQQKKLIQDLRRIDVENVNIELLIVCVENTRVTATNSLNELVARTRQPRPPRQLTFRDYASLLEKHQNLCHSAALYRTDQATYQQLVTTWRNKTSCRHCTADIKPSKMTIPDSNEPILLMINESGLLRAHCYKRGLVCIWRLREPSCYKVFENENALLRHLFAVHVKNEDSGEYTRVDWPADIRRGNIKKCGFHVRINETDMEDRNDNLVIPTRRVSTAPIRVTNPSRDSMFSTSSSMSTARSPYPSSASPLNRMLSAPPSYPGSANPLSRASTVLSGSSSASPPSRTPTSLPGNPSSVSLLSSVSAVSLGYSPLTSSFGMELDPTGTRERREAPNSQRYEASSSQRYEVYDNDIGQRYEIPNNERYELG